MHVVNASLVMWMTAFSACSGGGVGIPHEKRTVS
jgi:hypothetical protein